MDNNTQERMKIDWVITLFPLVIIAILASIFMISPNNSIKVMETLRSVFVGKLGFFYMILGLGVLIMAIWLALSPYGKIKLGEADSKPRYSNFAWGAMIFTSTMAADILYWSLIEWAYYFGANPFGMTDLDLVQRHDFALSYPLFHWGPIPWSFYLLPAVAYGYMFFVKGRNRQTLSEACRSTIGDKADGLLGRVMDIFSIVGLLAGTATTFSLATPLLSLALSTAFGIPESIALTIGILLLIAVVYTVAVLVGLKGISKLANICVFLFILLLGIFFICGPKIYIIESAVTGIGKMINDFLSMATWMDPIRAIEPNGSGFPQDWTIFYWAYWISWFVATPFFIGKISEGRTIRQTVLGGILCGLLGTWTSFTIFGNYGLFQQITGNVDAAGMLANNAPPSMVIVEIIKTLPIPNVTLVLLSVAMVAFYASTFDALTLVVAEYSIRNLKADQEPPKGIRVFWALVFIVLPIALIFNESTLNILQTLSIVAAFPLGIIMILVIYSFMKDLKRDSVK